MQELHSLAQNIIEEIDRIVSCLAFLIIKSALCDLNIPVTEVIPEEVNDLAQSNAELIVIKVNSSFIDKVVEFCKDPLIFCCEDGLINNVRCEIVICIHDDKSHGIPDLVGKITTHEDLIFLESLVITRSITSNKSKSQSIAAVLLNYFERIDTIGQKFVDKGCQDAAQGLPVPSEDAFREWSGKLVQDKIELLEELAGLLRLYYMEGYEQRANREKTEVPA